MEGFVTQFPVGIHASSQLGYIYHERTGRRQTGCLFSLLTDVVGRDDRPSAQLSGISAQMREMPVPDSIERGVPVPHTSTAAIASSDDPLKT